MVKESKPRRGSLQYWPRVRARRIYPRIRSWPKIDEVKPLGFAGYKVGMTHLIVIDNRKNSPTCGEKIFMPVTVIECPPITVFGVRLYKLTPYGLKTLTEAWAENLPEHLKRKIVTLPKERRVKPEDLEGFEFDDVRLLCCTNPKMAGIRKKTPEVFEIAIGGNDPKEKLKYALSVLGKQITVRDVFKEGDLVDVIAVTKGKGFEGPVKRFGIKLLHHKTKGESGRRKAGTLGPWTPSRLDYRRGVLPGQMGFHTRTEYNKWLIKISDNPDEINPPGGWPHYGLVRTTYILLKGSVPGPAKRLIRLRHAIRPDPRVPNVPPEIVYVYKPGYKGG